MKRLMRLLAVFSLVLMVGVVLGGEASADVLHGKGWLRAKGSGVATLRMTGEVEITGHGVGVIYIDGAEHIDAGSSGNRIDGPGGQVVFRGHEGKIYITGKHMVVRMVGGQIEFRAHGKGTAALRGRGVYQTKHRTGDWQPDGLTLAMEEE